MKSHNGHSKKELDPAIESRASEGFPFMLGVLLQRIMFMINNRIVHRVAVLCVRLQYCMYSVFKAFARMRVALLF